MKRYVCPECGVTRRDRKTLAAHRERDCKTPTTDGGSSGHPAGHPEKGDPKGDPTRVTRRNPNPDEGMPPLEAPGHLGSPPSSSPIVSKIEEVTQVTPGDPSAGDPAIMDLPAPGLTVEDPQARFREAVSFLSQWPGLLQPGFEQRLYHAAKHKVDSGNGRPFSQDQLDKLYEIEAVVRGILADLEQSREDNSRARHPLEALDPSHVKEGCRYCELEAEFRKQAREAFEADMAELAKPLPPATTPNLTQERRERKKGRVIFPVRRSPQGAPAASTPGAKSDLSATDLERLR